MYLGFILDYIFAWIAVFIAVFLLAKYLLRRALQCSEGERRKSLTKVNRYWKWPHIVFGFVLITIGLVHGLSSTVKVLSFNFGTVNWLVTVCFGLTWLFRNRLRSKWLRFHQVLAVLFLVTLVTHVINVGGINVFRILAEINEQTVYEATIPEYPQEVPEQSPGQEPEKTETGDGPNGGTTNKNNFTELELPYYFSFEGLELKDGVYVAEANGYSSGLKVQVTIEDNLIKQIKILQHHEIDSRYWKEAMEVIPGAIIEQQTLDVDAISGSSMTSVGIIRAVRKAVLEAIVHTN